MSSFLCFICHNAVNSATTEETREKYKEVVGMNLCPYSHICFVCSHMVNKLWLFKSVCVKRSLEYPVLFSEKCTLNLHTSDIEMLILCNETCLPSNRTQLICYNELKDQSNDYVELEEEKNDDEGNDEERNDEEGNVEVGNDEKSNDEEGNDEEGNDDVIGGAVESSVAEMEEGNIEKGDEFIDVFDDQPDLNENVQNMDVMEPQTKKNEKAEKNDYKKIILSVEEQKAELDAQRRTKKYLEAEFKCYNCAQGFLFKDSYQTHMMRHEESNGEHVCLLCTLRFASLAVLRSHKCGHRERYTCLHCGVIITKRQRRTHSRKHKKEMNAACHLCGNVFQDSSGLQQHLKRFHRSTTSNRTYSCNVCGRSFNKQAAVRSHMITHIQRKFTCDQCTSVFSSPYSLNQHKKKHTDNNTKEFVCVTCGLSYGSKKSLLDHMRRALQHQQIVFECPICNRMCPNSTSLTLHISRIHSTSKDFACTLCTNKYTSRNGLLRHIRQHTSRPKTVMAQCYVCGKSFKSNSKLNRHLREVCRKDKLEEELTAYNLQQDSLLVDIGSQSIAN